MSAWIALGLFLGAPQAGSPAVDDAPARLSAALGLKEDRRLDEALGQLEALARSGTGLDAASAAPPTAASVLADLEAIDTRLRLGRLDGVEPRLERLSDAWSSNRSIIRRIEPLAAMLRLRDGVLVEPNAISRADLGARFRERFLAGKKSGEPAGLPLDLPIRFLSELSPDPGHLPARGPSVRPVVVVGFLGIEDLDAPRREAFRPALDHFERGRRALLALFVFTGDAELPAPVSTEEPWTRAALFWIRGTPRALTAAPVRSRYEWLPGPSFFLVETGGRIRSWKWPHESWEGFQKDIQAAWDGSPPPGAALKR